MIKIDNLTFSYVPREDRIMFIVNHNEINNRVDLIVTRKKLIELLHGFDEILINYCDNGKIFKQLYKEQQPIQIEKSKDPTQQDRVKNAQKWEQSISKNDLDFTKLDSSYILDMIGFNSKENRFEFKFYSQNEVKAYAIMNSESFQKTLSSLMRVIPFVDWGISPHILD